MGTDDVDRPATGGGTVEPPIGPAAVPGPSATGPAGEPAAAERISYSFGTGRGAPHTWTDRADHDADGDGLADSVALDFDGDGRIDDALWDSDRDGVADTALLDLDDDGRADHAYGDPTGLGTWNRRGTALPAQPAPPTDQPTGPGRSEPMQPTPATQVGWTDRAGREHSSPVTEDVDGDGRDDAAWVDHDADGRADELAVDTDADGGFDELVVDSDGDGRTETAYLDTDADGQLDTMLVDTDGDGTVDQTFRAGDADYVDP